jgi:glycosyltransferase involved in cell wall biosynthesis
LDVAGESNNVFCAIVANARRVRAIRRLLRRERPDATIAMMSSTSVLLALAGLPSSTGVRLGTERTHPPRFPLGKLWEFARRIAYRHLDAVVVLSAEARRWILAHTSAKRVVVIPNPVVLPLPRAQPERSPAEVGSTGRRRVLAVGRLGAEKGFDTLLESFAMIGPERKDWELVIIGEGPLRIVLEQRIHELGIGDVVYLPGRVGNMADWYASADVFVLSSRFEGFPNVLAEAMAHGLAVVSTDCETGPRDLIVDGANGLLVPVEERSALASSMARLMVDDQLRAVMGAAAAGLSERFGIADVAKRWEFVLETSASCSVGPRRR